MSGIRRLALVLMLTASAPVPLALAQERIPPGYVLVDDMILPESVVYGDSAFSANPWPFGVVAYTFNANVSTANRTAAIRAMEEIAAVCGAIFVPRTNHPDWIAFNATTFNSSQVGMQGGGQTINITSWGTKYIIVHEIMHALGFIHEQSRTDRDTFVTINAANISTNGCPGSNCGGNGSSNCACNFNIVNGATNATPYDFLSIMHYGRNAFTANGQDTITCKPGFTQFQNSIGNRTFMSLGDAQGLQQRYGSTLYIPGIASISPTSVSTSQGSFTLHVYGSNFFGGSPDGNGVQGTKITWNGTQIATSFVDSGHVTAQIPANLISLPQTVQISVTNPSPGWGPVFSSIPLSVVCNTAPLALAPGVPTTTTNGCQQFSINPAYNTFNVVGVTSTTDWDIQMGTASAAAGGNTCDFVVGTGYAGAGTIQPTTGNVTLYSGNAPATLQYVTSTEVLNGQPTIASMPAGSIVRAFHFSAAAVSTRMIQIAGPNYLRWKLLWAGNGFSWRSSTTNVTASGTVGGGPVTGIGVVPAPYCLVVYSDGVPVPTTESLTITMCFDFTPTALTASNNITTINQGAYSCAPFSVTPQTGKWNVVGISSPSDWDIQIGAAVSQFGGGSCDYVLANGHYGAISPLSGVCSPYSFPGSAGSLQFAFTATLPQNWYSYTYMILAFEFEILTPGNYDISVAGGPGYNWDLHAPGGSAVWRRAADRRAGPRPADGSPLAVANLSPGWHCVVVYHDGGPTGLISPSISIGYSASQAPALASLSPSSAAAGGPAFALTATGSGFGSTSVVRWNGNDLPTTVLSATQLQASVAASLIASGTTATVTVANPGPSGGLSAPLSFVVNNPAPTLLTLAPPSIGAGGPAFTLNVNGTGFVPVSVVRWNGVDLSTSFVSATQLVAQVAASRIAAPGLFDVEVYSPVPAGGLSAIVPFAALPPEIQSLSPASISPMTPASAPVPVTVSGLGFHGASRIVANGVALTTTYNGPNQLSATLGPAVVQTTRPGGIAINVENAPAVVSNTRVIRVGSGANQGTIRRQPLIPALGQAYSALIEGGRADALFSLYVDLANVAPVTAWPDPSANLVLAVGPYVGSPGPFVPIIEGIGIHGPPTGARLDGNGAFNLPGFVLPNPPLGIDLTVQAIYLDAAAPWGFRLTWARWPDRL